MNIGTITIQVEGLDYKELEKYREMFLILIANSVGRVKNGKVILHFNESELNGLEIDVFSWKRGKSPPLAKINETSKIELKS